MEEEEEEEEEDENPFERIIWPLFPPALPKDGDHYQTPLYKPKNLPQRYSLISISRTYRNVIHSYLYIIMCNIHVYICMCTINKFTYVHVVGKLGYARHEKRRGVDPL